MTNSTLKTKIIANAKKMNLSAEEVKKYIDDMNKTLDKNIKNKKLIDTLFNAYMRYQDEKEYEDINDYLEVFKKYDKSIKKMSKRPFGIVFENKLLKGKIIIKANKTSYSVGYELCA